MAKVVVAMSGGVDSSVAAALLTEEGHQVIGVTMQIWPSDKRAEGADRFGGCCGISAIEDAKRVSYQLSIPHYVMNLRDIFAEKVISHFYREYRAGRTPNPCIRCNQHIKFDALLEKARMLGADLVATGHYAKIDRDEAGGRYLLKKGSDQHKDQSYVLYSLNQGQLKHTLLPVGAYTKGEVREMARKFGLPVAAKPESQEICFVPDNDLPRFLREYAPQKAEPGPILDKEGRILGRHPGILFYTIGQRKRLGISARKPLYVTAIDRDRNVIFVGTKQETYRSELIASDLNWIAFPGLDRPVKLKAKIRYLHPEAEAEITPLDSGRVRVEFNEPQMAITPGQAVVFYNGDTVVGGGTIEE